MVVRIAKLAAIHPPESPMTALPRPVPVLLALALAAACTAAHPATYDLKKQWSAKLNPHGAWTLEQGGVALPRDKDWTAISNADAAYNPPSGHVAQPAWAPGNAPGHYLPAWFKAAVTPADAQYGWLQGDLIVHSTDIYNGIGSGVASVLFTSPEAGTATISGYAYNARNMGRPQAWEVALNGVLLAEGRLPGDGTFTRAKRMNFSIAPQVVHVGDAITMTVHETDGSSTPGDFVGLDLTVAIH